MGKAARENMKQRQTRISSLNDDENVAREAAENLLRRFIVPSESTGMCYRMTFLLNLYLQEKGVASTPVVGWITDGRDDIAMSHAWLMVILRVLRKPNLMS
jgi:arylamine N-acetyltransferase